MATQNLKVNILTGYSGGGMLRTGRDLRSMANSATRAARAFDHFSSRSTRALRGITHMMTRQVGNVFRSFFFGVRIYAIAAGAAVSGFVVTAVKSFIEFDKKLRETTSLIAGASAAGGSSKSLAGRLKKARREAQREYELYKRDILAMSVGLRTTPQALAAAAYEPVSAGYSGPGQSAIGLRLLRAGAMGAAAGGGEAQTATRILIQTMNALGLKKPNRRVNGRLVTGGPLSGQRGEMAIMDRIFQAVNYGVGTNFPDISSAIGNVIGPIGAAMNPKGTKSPGRGMKALEQVLATIVIGSQRGLTASKSTIGMADIIKRIMKPTKAAQDLYEQMGITPGAGLLQKGVIGTGGAIAQLQKGLAKLGYSGAKASEGFNILFGDIRAMRVVTTLLNTGLTDTDSVLKLIADSAGATQAAFDEQGRSVDGAIKKFQALFETIKIGIGGGLAPTVSAAIASAEGFINRLTGGARGGELVRLRADNMDMSMSQFQEKYFTQAGDTAAYKAYQRFSGAGFKGQAKMFFGELRDSLVKWWQSPDTQTMLADALQTALDKAMQLLGAAVDKMPSVYNVGIHIGAKIAEGILTGLVPDAIGGGGSRAAGGGGLLQGAPLLDRLFALLPAALIGKGALDKFSGNSIGNRLGRGVGIAAAGGLAGIPSMLLPALALMGGIMPGRGGATSQEQLIGNAVADALGSRGDGTFTMTANVVNLHARQLNVAGGGATGRGGARGRAADPIYGGGQRRHPRAGTAAVPSLNTPGARFYMGPIGTQLGPITDPRRLLGSGSYGGGMPYAQTPVIGPDGIPRINGVPVHRATSGFPARGNRPGPGTPMFIPGMNPGYSPVGAAAGPRQAFIPGMNPLFMQQQIQRELSKRFPRVDSGYTGPGRVRGGFNMLRAMGASALGKPGALGAAGMMAMAGGGALLGGGGKNAMIGSAAGGALGALGFLVPGAGALLGPALMMLGGMAGSFGGGLLDQRAAAAEKAKQDAALQSVFRSMTTATGVDRKTLMQQLPYQLGATAGLTPGGTMKGLTDLQGVATVGSTNLLAGGLMRLGRAKNSAAFEKALAQVDTYMTANGISADTQLGINIAALVQMSRDNVIQIEAKKAEEKMLKEMYGIEPLPGPAKRRKRHGVTPGVKGSGRFALEGPGGSVGTDFSARKNMMQPAAAAYVNTFRETVIGKGGAVQETVTKAFVNPVSAAGQAAATGYVSEWTTYIRTTGGQRITTAMTDVLRGITPSTRLLPNGQVETIPQDAIGSQIKSDGVRYLHKGERVVPAAAVRNYRFPADQTRGGGGVVVQGPLIGNANINNEGDAEMVANKLAKALKRHQVNSGRL